MAPFTTEVLSSTELDEGIKLRMSSVYNENSEAQASGAAFLTTFLCRAAASVHASLPQGVPLEICEYGCSTGGSSILPLLSIKNVADDRSLRVSLNDLPMNDWAILKKTVEPMFPDIEFSYKPKSMYGPVTDKEGTLHIAYSCYAQHWLRDGAPTGLPYGALWASQLPFDNPYRRIWEQDSKQQWADLLAQRAREVAAGGMMVFHIESAKCCGKLSQGFSDTLQHAKLAMINNGELSDEEALSMVVPEFSKTPADILAPLVNGPMMQLWEVQELQYQTMPCPYLKEFEAQEKADPEMTCEKLLGFVRAFTETSLVECIGEEKLDSFWKHVQRIADNDPKKLSSDNIFGTFISLRRSSAPVPPTNLTVCA